ncbi:MAG: hypothetical protein JSW08_03595 [archaeon]|nr:MAG: hypothetical protein JSW08_03595 [archaeon]
MKGKYTLRDKMRALGEWVERTPLIEKIRGATETARYISHRAREGLTRFVEGSNIRKPEKWLPASLVPVYYRWRAGRKDE